MQNGTDIRYCPLPPLSDLVIHVAEAIPRWVNSSELIRNSELIRTYPNLSEFIKNISELIRLAQIDSDNLG